VTARVLKAGDAEAAGELLVQAFSRARGDHGALSPYGSVKDAAEAVAALCAAEPEGALGAWDDGRLLAVGFLRKRGDVATLGPLGVATPRQGHGGRLLDELIACAEGWSCGAIRVFQDAGNADSFALFAGRCFAPVDVVACLARPAGAPPRLDAARGLEISPLRPGDLPEIFTLDHRLTGLERRTDLEQRVRFVARRRGALAGFLGMDENRLGPALALDVADLGALMVRALGECTLPAVARLSTAAPTALLAALGLGFRVVSVGAILSRGVAPPTRPPQLYSLSPEIL
jgi:hypothetical protein